MLRDKEVILEISFKDSFLLSEHVNLMSPFNESSTKKLL